MSTRYELGLSSGYVASWGVLEGLREFFQNAIDQQAVDAENEWSWKYDEEKQTLRISNKLSVLDRRSLLLGASSKVGDDRTIGKFGEGYKLAIVVLLRNGCGVTFYNYKAKETWTTKLVNSKRYGDVIPVVDISKSYWSKLPDQNLTVEITGIAQDYMDGIVNRILQLKYPDGWDCVKGDRCSAMLNEEEQGNIYVNGVYVDNQRTLKYGYDFTPAALSLDRDRGMVRSFDVDWETSRLWSEVSGDWPDILKKMLTDECSDIRFIANFETSRNKSAEIAADAFYTKHGDKAYPVSSQDEAESVPAGYKPIVVNSLVSSLVKKSKTWTMMPAPVSPMEERWNTWWEKYHLMLSVEGREELKEFVEELMEDD